MDSLFLVVICTSCACRDALVPRAASATVSAVCEKCQQAGRVGVARFWQAAAARLRGRA